ncbi:MAG: glycosyltransferase [Pseudomonadales bacterium]|nr:glycosyltransferase [Pseudomonadales bacterium]
MKIIVYSEVNADNASTSLGKPDYSYYFVLKDYLPALKKMGEVIIAKSIEDIDKIYSANGEKDCVFLSFTPPQKTPQNLNCPTFPVFAWEFSTIPNEHWLDDPNQNWAEVLKHFGQAITHSELTVSAVKQASGNDMLIESIPAPVWDRCQGLYEQVKSRALDAVQQIDIKKAIVFDTNNPEHRQCIPNHDEIKHAVSVARSPDKQPKPTKKEIRSKFIDEWRENVLKPFSPFLYRATSSNEHLSKRFSSGSGNIRVKNIVEPTSVEGSDFFDSPVLTPGDHQLELSGVIFTSLFNPYDGRKNWGDMMMGFIAAFKDNPDATLVFKLAHHKYKAAFNDMLMCMALMGDFKCRVVIIHGYLSADSYQKLMTSTHYIVNASYGEGQCLPLMESLSAGIPAIAPRHSAMVDYINEDIAFIVDSWEDATAWSHDPRLAYRTLRHQIHWESLVDAYKKAYRRVKESPMLYRHMQEAANQRMKNHCSEAVAITKMQSLFSRMKEASSESQ